MVRPIGTWLAQHPVGLIVLSMLELHQDRSDSAAKAIQMHINKVGGADRTRFADMAACIGPHTGKGVGAPWATRLPSAYQVRL